MKENVALIGRGKWGGVLKKKLNDLSNLKSVSGKNYSLFSEIKKNNIKWVFIATSNNSHYQIVKKSIKYGLNVFCEKPLCSSSHKAKKLIEYAKKNKVKLFVSDIYEYYSHKIKILKKNEISRSKFVSGIDREFLYRFMYHDLSILYNFIKKKNALKFINIKKERKKYFKILLRFRNNIDFNFIYNLNVKKKEHYINQKKINSKKDILKIMIKNVLLNKVDFKENNNKALHIIKFIELIKKNQKNVN
tara:strand:- start:1389 stop:2129 length:741 start_codon:yes stop_codon:yes gene_type:complete